MKTITYDETKFVLVPKEPTEEMLDSIGITRCTNRAIWEAMVAAAPKLEEGK